MTELPTEAEERELMKDLFARVSFDRKPKYMPDVPDPEGEDDE